MVETHHLLDEEISTARAAVIASELTESVSHIHEDRVQIDFDHAPIELDYLVRHHGFKLSPSTAKKDYIELYKRRNR